MFVKKDRWSTYFRLWFSKKESFLRKLKLSYLKPMDTSTLHAILHAQINLFLGEKRYAVKMLSNRPGGARICPKIPDWMSNNLAGREK